MTKYSSNFNPELECLVQVLRKEERDILRDSDVDVILCLDEYKTVVQARNAVCPGLTTFVENMRTLGEMAKGAVDFDLEQAKAALADMKRTAKTVPGLFKSDEMHPKSEALPLIWSNFADFTAKSEALEDAAAQALASFSSKDDLVPSMRALGGTCKSCHLTYRK